MEPQRAGRVMLVRPFSGEISLASSSGWRNPHRSGLKDTKEHTMNTPLKAGIAGFAAWKWGGGILGAIILFVIVFWLLGRF